MTRLVDVTTRLRTSGRRAFEVMRRRDWLVVIAACTAGLLLFTTMLVAQVDAYHARSQAAEQAQAQASIVADQRAAQTRRIDQLTDQLQATREQVASQSRLVGRQEQAIRDLASQVDQLGGLPVTSRVTADRAATRTPLTTRTTRPTTAPSATSSSKPQPGTTKPRATSKPPATPSPTSTPRDDDGPLGLCVLLPLC